MADTIAAQPLPAEYRYRIRLIDALSAGTLAGIAALVFYYLTLGLLPALFAYPATEFPLPAWAHRFDIAQFLGTFAFPPLPSAFTWFVGILLWLGTLSSLGVVYALLLSWSLQASDVVKGVGVGIGLWLTMGLLLTLAQGYQPGVMRIAVPDTGVFMLGWSVWALIQLLVVFLIYGALLGRFYRRDDA